MRNRFKKGDDNEAKKPEVREKLSKIMKQQYNDGVRKNFTNKGNIHSDETRKKISEGVRKAYKSGKLKSPKYWEGKFGKDHARYKGNTKLNVAIRNMPEYKKWREAVFSRDDYICQKCSIRGGNLEAHHKEKFYKLLKDENINNTKDAVNNKILWDIDNGVTLCIECHRKFKDYGVKV